MSNHETRDIFLWLNQVLADHALPLNAFRLAYAIAQHINRASGKAWPSQATLAARAGLDPRSVRRLSTKLEGAGHISVDVHHGRNQTNVYRLLMTEIQVDDADSGGIFVAPETLAVPPSLEENRTAVSSYSDANKDSSVLISPSENRTPASSFPENRTIVAVYEDKSCTKTGQQRPTNHLRTIDEPMREGARQQSAPSGALIVASPVGEIVVPEGEDPFPYFWREAPKQTGEAFAKQAFAAALKRAPASVIIAGMRRYAQSRIGEEHRYTTNPTKWLEGDSWKDRLELKAKGSGPARSGGARGKPSFLEIAVAHANRMDGEP